MADFLVRYMAKLLQYKDMEIPEKSSLINSLISSARLYGSRSNKNKKLLEDVNKAVAENLNSKE